jgi:hypothetical protein
MVHHLAPEKQVKLLRITYLWIEILFQLHFSWKNWLWKIYQFWQFNPWIWLDHDSDYLKKESKKE